MAAVRALAQVPPGRPQAVRSLLLDLLLRVRLLLALLQVRHQRQTQPHRALMRSPRLRATRPTRRRVPHRHRHRSQLIPGMRRKLRCHQHSQPMRPPLQRIIRAAPPMCHKARRQRQGRMLPRHLLLTRERNPNRAQRRPPRRHRSPPLPPRTPGERI